MAPARLPLEGSRYGRLTVASEAQRSPAKCRRWLCVCECGNTKVVHQSALRSGGTVSCGCYRSARSSARLARRATRHGHSPANSRSGAYKSWMAMRDRCLNPNAACYRHYGGRGITVDPRWNDFAAFHADMGDRPEGLTLDRIDVNGNYGPGNCKWSTVAEQNANRRDSRRV